MREIRSPRVILPTLSSGAGGKKAREHVKDRRAEPDAKLTFPSHWNNGDIRGALAAVSGKACAYCGCYLPRNDRGDVEHYRPKGKVDEEPGHGGYWWIAYSLANYFLSCSVCNRSRKRTKFPLRSSRARRVKYADRSRLRREARLLIDPAADAIEEWLQVDLENHIGRISPREGLSRTQRKQVEGTLEFFRINRDKTLRRERRTVVSTIVDALEQGREEDAKHLAIRYRPHSLCAKQVLERYAVHLLPTPREELQWWLDEIVVDIETTLNVIEGEGMDDIHRRELNELLWSLAVIWKDPPAGTQAEIETFLVNSGVEPDVRERFEQLSSV